MAPSDKAAAPRTKRGKRARVPAGDDYVPVVPLQVQDADDQPVQVRGRGVRPA